MFKALAKILKIGIVTEKLVEPEKSPIEIIGETCKAIIDAKFAGSLAIRQVDAGSCNGCELEIHALNNSFYDIERFSSTQFLL